MNVKNILKKCAIALAPTIICIALGLLAGYLILLFSNPAQAGNGFRAILSGGFIGGNRGIGDVFYYATPLLMVGLGVAVGFKTGVFIKKELLILWRSSSLTIKKAWIISLN